MGAVDRDGNPVAAGEPGDVGHLVGAVAAVDDAEDRASEYYAASAPDSCSGSRRGAATPANYLPRADSPGRSSARRAFPAACSDAGLENWEQQKAEKNLRAVKSRL